MSSPLAMSLGRTLKREVRVALSRKAQSLRFRLVKWILTIAAIVWLWPSPYFWWIVGGALAASISLHLFWRYKTNGWTGRGSAGTTSTRPTGNNGYVRPPHVETGTLAA